MFLIPLNSTPMQQHFSSFFRVVHHAKAAFSATQCIAISVIGLITYNLYGSELSSRIEVKRECILKAVIIYLNENPENLIKEYMAFNVMEAEELKRMDLGVYKGRRSLQMKEHSLMTPLKMLASLSRDAPSCRIFTMWRAGVHFCLG
ncbi:uncharacterized protein LOC120731440 isoform X3 [Simochromis diagramma]|uniref:uncharacterized protein LOC120731440 isoform X3 n=1 Tax=Simochromis diagramma TaxID=43689 RepID=UPI001A7EFD64|nr:uncharacterized protein LOC120731440 isoform X3 [Simochromis diagramma]